MAKQFLFVSVLLSSWALADMQKVPDLHNQGPNERGLPSPGEQRAPLSNDEDQAAKAMKIYQELQTLFDLAFSSGPPRSETEAMNTLAAIPDMDENSIKRIKKKLAAVDNWQDRQHMRSLPLSQKESLLNEERDLVLRELASASSLTPSQFSRAFKVFHALNIRATFLKADVGDPVKARRYETEAQLIEQLILSKTGISALVVDGFDAMKRPDGALSKKRPPGLAVQ